MAWYDLWRPMVPESSDGKPLVSTISELFLNFPLDRLPTDDNNLTAWAMRPNVVAALLLFYLVSKPLLKAALPSDKTALAKSSAFRAAVALHNMVLAVFSAVCAWNGWGVVLEHLSNRGAFSVYCDLDGSLWNKAGLGAWSTIFYISKYYEFLDTWILVLKGKEASFLQVYHHTGIAFIMWCGVASQSAWLLFVVLLNSVIHTFMYTYFFIKTVSPTTEIKSARYLTNAQIGQFITGIACTLPIFILGDECDSESSRFALACLHVYGFGLIALFFAFSKRKYKKN